MLDGHCGIEHIIVNLSSRYLATQPKLPKRAKAYAWSVETNTDTEICTTQGIGVS